MHIYLHIRYSSVGNTKGGWKVFVVTLGQGNLRLSSFLFFNCFLAAMPGRRCACKGCHPPRKAGVYCGCGRMPQRGTVLQGTRWLCSTCAGKSWGGRPSRRFPQPRGQSEDEVPSMAHGRLLDSTPTPSRRASMAAAIYSVGKY